MNHARHQLQRHPNPRERGSPPSGGRGSCRAGNPLGRARLPPSRQPLGRARLPPSRQPLGRARLPPSRQPLGRARLPPSRPTPWEGEAPAEPATPWEGEAPAEPAAPWEGEAPAEPRVVTNRSPSFPARSHLTHNQTPPNCSAQRELSPPKGSTPLASHSAAAHRISH